MRASSARARSLSSLARLVRRGRELPALGLALVWLFGVVIAPVLHLALHASLAPHTHAIASSDGDACHDDHCHRALDHEDDDHEAPTDHGRGSALHGDVAALFPVPALVLPPFVAIGELSPPRAHDDIVEALTMPPSRARGPPTRT
ncbi:MAG: hypothetical protein J0L92_03095 [Deltaproteobacteria bacterium]|nr:hypothetical protein [Deltaproteobacteria bacterium]